MIDVMKSDQTQSKEIQLCQSPFCGSLNTAWTQEALTKQPTENSLGHRKSKVTTVSTHSDLKRRTNTRKKETESSVRKKKCSALAGS